MRAGDVNEGKRRPCSSSIRARRNGCSRCISNSFESNAIVLVHEVAGLRRRPTRSNQATREEFGTSLWLQEGSAAAEQRRCVTASGSRGAELGVEAALHARDIRSDAEEQVERHGTLKYRHAIAIQRATAVLTGCA